MKRAQRRVLAVDVCGTLYDANTTAEFCLYHHRQADNKKRYLLLRAISRRGSVAWVALAGLDRILRIDLHRWLTIRSLRGESRGALERSVVRYVDTLAERAVRPVDELLIHLRQKNPETVLISNGLDIVIGEIAGRRGLPWLASKLAFRRGRCQGRLEVDLMGRKREALERWLGCRLDGVGLEVVTDNRSDADIIAVAARAHIVHKGPIKPWMRAFDAQFIGH
ncbi:Phosphoserine phosphatase [Paracoccus solventivorans]|uniref:Phosphoserine phosphatase n=1 Tax=Paracoccus solventivorans TaxID=53463 RepID=A0A1M7DAC5_9RHOB|nr:HAD family hydrolase [Paracoccus solventivorans]SHL76471.1 Phosphoserine phosphatase [Paracoccus solventivorans]